MQNKSEHKTFAEALMFHFDVFNCYNDDIFS